MIYIGIDPGVKTGIAVWWRCEQKFQYITSYMIHDAINIVGCMAGKEQGITVIMEDARIKTWGGTKYGSKKDLSRIQGAGSIKRDCKIWEDFLKDFDITYKLVPPKKSITKLDKAQFKKITGWSKGTNEHGRDAAMLVFGM